MTTRKKGDVHLVGPENLAPHLCSRGLDIFNRSEILSAESPPGPSARLGPWSCCARRRTVSSSKFSIT